MSEQPLHPSGEPLDARELARNDSDGEGIDIQGDVQIDGDMVGGDKRVGEVRGSSRDVVGGDKFVEQDAGDSYDVVRGNKITNWTGIKIGTFNLDTRFLIGLILAAAVVAVAAWWYIVPATMPLGTKNIAIANFGEADSNGSVSSSARGSALSQWLFDRMSQFAADKSNLPPDGHITLWHDSMNFLQKRANIGLIRSEAEAAVKARELNADIVVYGNLKPGGQPLYPFEPLFYVNKDRVDVKTAEADELTGAQELGKALGIQYPLNTSYLNLQLEPRGRALVWFVSGIGYDLVGEYDDAYQIFCQAKSSLYGWKDDQGKEVLYYFLGRQALFLARTDELARQTLNLPPENWGSRQRDEAGSKCEPFESAVQANQAAEMWFKRAINTNPEYARGYFGLGQVYSQRANNVLRTRPTDPAILQKMRDDLNTAIEQYSLAQKYMPPLTDSGNAPSLINLKNTAALGSNYALLANSYILQGDWDSALRNLDLAQEPLEELTKPGVIPASEERLLAQSYYTLAATQRLKGHGLEAQATALVNNNAMAEAEQKYAAEKQVLAAAAVNLERCLSIAEPSRTVDQLLLTDVGPKCQKMLDEVNTALAKLTQ